jgi:hypothetical protein
MSGDHEKPEVEIHPCILYHEKSGATAVRITGYIGSQRSASVRIYSELGDLSLGAVFIHRLGEIRDRTFENQQHRASGLNLLVAAIILWNTRYLNRVIAALSEVKDVPDHAPGEWGTEPKGGKLHGHSLRLASYAALKLSGLRAKHPSKLDGRGGVQALPSRLGGFYP